MTLAPSVPVRLQPAPSPGRRTRTVAIAVGAGAALQLALQAGPAQVVLVLLGLLLGGVAVAGLRRSSAGRSHQRDDELPPLSQQVLHDPLTGLPNRVLVEHRLRAALARADLSGGTVGLLSLDLDDFRAVNDRYGSAAGDELLVTVGQVLRSVVRTADTAGRLSGDPLCQWRCPCRGAVPLPGRASPPSQP